MDKENGAGNSLKTVFLRLIRMAITDYDRLTNMHPGGRRKTVTFPSDCNEQEKELMKFLFENESVRSKQVEVLLNIKEIRTRELLRGMVEKEHIERHGQGRRTFYTLAV